MYKKFFCLQRFATGVTLTNGDDIYENNRYDQMIYGIGGNDSIINNRINVSVDGGSGNDTVVNNASDVSIDGGDDDDIISLNGGLWDNTVRGGKGNDTVFQNDDGFHHIYYYEKGDGQDTVIGLFESFYIDAPTVESNDFIVKTESLMAGNAYSVSLDGEDLVVKVDDGSIRTKDTKEKGITVNDSSDIKLNFYGDANGKLAINYRNATKDATVHGLTGNDTIKNDAGNVQVYSGEGNDSIENTASNVIIMTGDGDDTISNSRNAELYGEAGNDYIQNNAFSSSINAGAGNDTVIIESGTSYSTVDGGEDADIISLNGGWDAAHDTINGGKGNDTIAINTTFGKISVDGGDDDDIISLNGGLWDNTVGGGKGNDTVFQNGDGFHHIYYYEKGDGQDTVIGSFESFYINAPTVEGNDFIIKTASLMAGNAYAVSLDGNDLVVKVADGSIRTKNTKETGITVNDLSDIKINFYGDANGKLAINHKNEYTGATVHGLTGNDIINNTASNVTIYAGEGNDTISNSGSSSYINTGDGDNYVSLKSSQHIVQLGNGNNTVEIEGVVTTINGGAGNDLIQSYDNLTPQWFQWAAAGLYFDGGGGDDTIKAWYPSKNLDGTSPIYNNITKHFEFYDGAFCTFKGGVGDDIIIADTSPHILAADGQYILAYDAFFLLQGDEGNDYIYSNNIIESTVIGGDGDDTLVGDGHFNYSTVIGGKGDDIISLNGSGMDRVIQYVAGDGNDTILGSRFDTIQIVNSNYTAATVGNDIILTVGEGSILVKEGVGNFISVTKVKLVETPSWTLNGTKATYGTTDETLITVNGVKSIDGLTLKDKVVTVAASSLNEEEVTISDGYTLALADDVAKVQDVSATWSVTNGTATYKGGKTAGYTVNGNKVIYSQAVDSETLATITGLKSDATSSGITTSANVITLNSSVLDKKEVTLTGDGYTLALADDVERPTAVTASWKVSDGTATYRGSTTAGYVVENNKITYQAASDDESIMTVTGLNVNAANNDISLENGVLTLSENAIGNGTISIEKTVDISKISAGKAGNFLIGSQTFKTDTSVDFIINSGGNVSAVELANMESTTFTNSADNISILGGTGNDVITNSGNGITFKAGLGNDTITNTGTNNIFQYTKGEGDDVIVGFGESDTLIISSDTYNTSIVGGDLQVNLVKSQNTIILKDGANLTPNIEGTWSDGYFDKDGTEIKNPVAQIEIDGEIYYYESVARATNDAQNNSIVTVTANSTETSTINATKGLTIQFAESGLGVYSVTGGNFISADSSISTQFSLSSNRVLSNSNSLLINNGATATVDGYAVTGTSNGYAFALQENSFTLNNISYSGAGMATFDTSENISVTSGAIVTTTDTATINLAAGSYTINGVEFSAASNNKAVTTSDGVKFNLSTDTVTYNSMAFNGAGSATIQSDTGIYLTGGAIVSSVAAGQNFTFNGSGTYKLNNKTIVTLSERPLTVTNTAEGLTIGENTFAITGDDEYRINVDANGKIISASNINGGSTIVNAGGADSILTSSAGNFTFGEKTFAIGGDDSVIFGLSSDGTVTKIADIVGTVSGDFTGAININGNAADVLITGDNSINVTTAEKGAASISDISNNASVIGTGGASVVSTDEEGTFNFYVSQNFTIGGDDSVDFKVNNSVVTGIANFENGTLQIDNAAKLSINNEDLMPQFTDTATFIIADSQVVSVDGFAAISGLSNATVHATGNVTVNGANVNVTGDSDFNVIVSDSKVTGLANISAGASVKVANVNVTTDNNGDFKVGENLYTINDADGSVTFITNSNGAVENVTNFNGTLNTNSQNVTVNGADLTTNDTNVTISSAGTGISQINGIGSGDVLSGDIDSAAVVVTVTSADDTALWSLNNRTYTLTGDSDGVQVTGNRIDGLDNAASLEVGAADTYFVNGTRLDAKKLDTIIGTAESSAYIFDPNNVPLDVSSMTDDEISAQVGISTEFATSETDTEKSAALINDASKLNGNMELALSNSDTTTAQTADFTNSTGKKKVTLAEGSQEVKFNNEGGNVAIIESDSAGEKNITLGNGGDLAIVKGTSTPVNITAGAGKDTIVTSGNNVTVDMKGGATKIVPNGGNVNLTNYDAATGAGIQIDEVSDIERAVENGNINFGDGVVSLGSATVNLGNSESESTTVNLFDNKGRKTKVAYTHSDGGTIDASNERENILLVGNNNSTKSNGSILKSGAGNDMAFGGAGDYFDLGAGNNRVYLDSNRSSGSSGATVAMTATSGTTEVNGFNSGFGENGDKLSINVSGASVSFEGGKLTFNVGNAALVLNFTGSSADLIADDNFIGSTTLEEISPITYEQGDYQNIYGENDSLKGGVPMTFTDA